MKYNPEELFEDAQAVFVIAAKLTEDRGLTGSQYAEYLLAILDETHALWRRTAFPEKKSDCQIDQEFAGMIDALRGKK